MVFRRRGSKQPPDPLAEIDPARVPPAYRPAVDDAIRARTQFTALVGSMGTGPLRQRLDTLQHGIDAGAIAVWRAVQQAVRLETVVATLDPQRVTDDLKQAKRAHQSGQGDAATVEVLSARFASTQRLLNALDELRDRIPLLEARLGTAVARAAELTLASSAASMAGLDALQGELDDLVIELEALQAAVDEVG